MSGTIRRILMALALLPIMAHAQESEAVDYVSDNEGNRTVGAVWSEIGATKLLPYNLSLGIDAGFRTDDWFNDASRFDLGIGLSWKASKHWKFGLGYTFINKHYPTETERKTVYEKGTEYKYSIFDATGLEVEEMKPDPTSLHGYPDYTTDGLPFNGSNVYLNEDGNSYRYKGYNDFQKTKDYVRVTDDYWRVKHRVSVDAAYNTSRLWGWLRISLRERYQLTYTPTKDVSRTRTKTTTKTTARYRDPQYDIVYSDDYTSWNYVLDYYNSEPGKNWNSTTHPENPETTTAVEVEDSQKSKRSKWLHTLRSRLSFEIDKKGWRVTPFLYIEAFNDLAYDMHLDKFRSSVGLDYALSKKHKLSIGYIFNHENDDDGNEDIHAVSIGYKFKF